MRGRHLAPLLAVVLLLTAACASAPVKLTPEQVALAAIRTTDAIYLSARTWANTEHNAGRLSDARFASIAAAAEKVRVAREGAVAALTLYLRATAPRDTAALDAATAALNTAHHELTSAAPEASP